MNEIKILDCTLRDGGSVNSSIFNEKDFISIVNCLDKSLIDIVELGFLQSNLTDLDFLNIYKNLFASNPELKEKSVIMVDISKSVNNLENISGLNLNKFRIMFKKEQINKALDYCYKLKNSGYEIIVNPVSVTSYTKQDIVHLVKELNNLNPEIAYIIDTYGLMDKEETLKYFNLFNDNLNGDIKIGYHAHNNRQLAFSNAVELININSFRNLVIDSSLFGMGKRAGNIPTELITDYLNKKREAKYNIETLLSAVQDIIMPIYEHYKWGYSLIHFIASANRCHSDYVSYLLNEKKIPIECINKFLNKIDADKKLCFDKAYTDELLKRR